MLPSCNLAPFAIMRVALAIGIWVKNKCHDMIIHDYVPLPLLGESEVLLNCGPACGLPTALVPKIMLFKKGKERNVIKL